MTEQRAAGPGRPRDPGVDCRVMDATLGMLAERGYAALRIDEIVKSSGVAKTTIYRRWPSLPLLVLDTMQAALGDRRPPSTGDPLADLEATLTIVHESLVANPVGWNLPAIGMDLLRQPDLVDEYRRRFVLPLRAHAIELVRQGTARGVFRPVADAAQIVDAVSGAFAFRTLVGEPRPPSLPALIAVARAALGVDPATRPAVG